MERTISGTDTRRGVENYIRDGYKKRVEKTILGTDTRREGGNQRRILGRSGGRKLYEYKPVIIVSFVGSSRNAIHSPAVVFLNIIDICSFYTRYNETDY